MRDTFSPVFIPNPYLARYAIRRLPNISAAAMPANIVRRSVWQVSANSPTMMMFLSRDDHIDVLAMRSDCRRAEPQSISPRNGMNTQYSLSTSANSSRWSAIVPDRVNGITQYSEKTNISTVIPRIIAVQSLVPYT